MLATSQRRKSVWRSSSVSAALDNPDNKSLPAEEESKICHISYNNKQRFTECKVLSNLEARGNARNSIFKIVIACVVGAKLL